MDVIVNAEFGGKLRESAACLLLLLLRFICSIWCLTQYPARKKTLMCGRRKSLVFCPSWNLIQKFRILEDKKQTEGEGRQADRHQTDWRTSVSENSPNNLQPPTEVSPFVWSLERGACTAGPILITSVREIRTSEWTGDIRFQISLVGLVCAHRFNAHAVPRLRYLSPNDPLPAAQTLRALREGCWAGFSPSPLDVCTSHPLRVSTPRFVFLHPRGGRADLIALYTW